MIVHKSQINSEKFLWFLEGSIVKNWRFKICSKIFRPKWRLAKSIPGLAPAVVVVVVGVEPVDGGQVGACEVKEISVFTRGSES
jgi:hypothetical protein